MYLIRACVCGSLGPFDVVRGPLEIENARCRCGVIFQLTTRSRVEVEGEYSAGDYHRSNDRHPGLIPYAARYDTDRATARVRIRTYAERVGHVFRHPSLRALDVGCANGAFTDELLEQGVDAYGCDVDPVGGERDRIRRGTIDTQLGRYDLVTYHDVLEHLVDPLAELERARTKIHPGGFIVVDVPDVCDPAGAKHFKREHLWYFTIGALRDLLGRAEFAAGDTYRPIPGKLVMLGFAA